MFALPIEITTGVIRIGILWSLPLEYGRQWKLGVSVPALIPSLPSVLLSIHIFSIPGPNITLDGDAGGGLIASVTSSLD
ncbi:hypothetical protein M408DRAFT_24123 [Serendipita vermifera MAFF 305830]|uniref:Uncharacterized protein n=1 Tax=Serendipita vermifera MAFF 305830 TaxID=933852 RepID=A0A0C3B7N0_SERVB|nr:hypothetical protein M408DRAFT_24123 [Serendipita vermifera MAFF 305830]